ncbi:MAG: RelE/StbE family addiction module toxin [bacterium]|nr:MAG: RelE/StbE family addiction module toxin [bacterium]KAF0148718.1 MAG: RelE/StbE family addiction module toxin [bacterium]KAF0168208.1 MAG: RelE/StbE family addiction module toxin [bacterium]TXT18731.1 MAG: RelE/StbE family addiction module toxin [bacterium]
MRVRYTPAAREHLGEIGGYIAKDNREAATRVIRAIREAVDLLRDNPDMGRRGHLDGTRELVIPRLPYYVAYRVTETAVEVFAVIHTARSWPEREA